MSKVQELPCVVLLKIFHILLEDPPSLPPLSTESRQVLTQTCSRWRTLVISCPAFWQNIGLAPAKFSNSIHLLRTFKEWAARSGNLPLTVNFCQDSQRYLGGRMPQRVEQLLYGGGAFSIVRQIIVPYAGRITVLTCMLCKEEIRAFLNLPAGSLRSVIYVDLTLINDFVVRVSNFSFEQHMNFSVFKGAVHLTHAIIHILNGIHPIDLKLPWSQLTKIDLTGLSIPPQLCLRLMRLSAPNLINAAFEIKFTKYHTLGLAPVLGNVTMLYLTQLHLYLIEPSLDHGFLSSLIMPTLTCLRIERKEERQGEFGTNIFIPMFRRLAFTLRQLEIQNFPLFRALIPGEASPHTDQRKSYDDIENLFLAIPNIQVLRLPHRTYIHSTTIEKLAAHELLPALTTLEVSASSFDNARHHLLMLERRNQKLYLGIGSSSSLPKFHLAISSLRLWVEYSREYDDLMRVVGPCLMHYGAHVKVDVLRI